MAGGAKGSSSNHNKSHSSSSSGKSRWENDNNKKSKNPNEAHPKPGTNYKAGPSSLEKGDLNREGSSYGFDKLERRSIVLGDGSVRSYFALPEGYDFGGPHEMGMRHGPNGMVGQGHGPHEMGMRHGPNGMVGQGHGPHEMGMRHGPNGMVGQGHGPHGMGVGQGKRKYEDEREVAWQRQQLMHFPRMNPHAGPSNPRELVGLGGGDEFRMAKQMRVGGGYQGSKVTTSVNKHNEVDQSALKKAFLHFVKLLNENANQKKLYLEKGKQGHLNCVVCGRSGRDFPDMHALIMHTYNPDRADHLVDHLGLHKALCLLMGWNYSRAPDNSKAYMSLSANEAAANQDDVILWPPTVVVHNTITGKGKEGRMDGLGNKAMDAKMRELGFASGKAKSVYGKEGHLGISLIKFPADQSGLKDAVRLADFFEREKRGRKVWGRVQPSSTMGKDDEKNPNLMEFDKKTGEKQRILYGYLGTVFDLDKLDFDTRKKIQIETRRDYGAAK